MSRKVSVHHNSRYRKEEGRPQSAKRHSHDFDNRKRQLAEQYTSRPRRKPIPRTQANNVHSSPHQAVRKRRNNADYRRYDQTSSSKSSGSILFSFVANLVFYGITIGIIAMAVMFSFSSKSTASIFGYRFYTVLTNSMVPQKDGLEGGFYAGDIVIVKLTDGNKVKKDDVVTFSVGDGSRYLTHRIVDRKEELNGEKGDYIITKGDANKSNDPPILSDRILGKVVFAIPKAGDVLEFIREQFWACLVGVLSLYGFILVLKAYLFSQSGYEHPSVQRKNTNYPTYNQ